MKSLNLCIDVAPAIVDATRVLEFLRTGIPVTLARSNGTLVTVTSESLPAGLTYEVHYANNAGSEEKGNTAKTSRIDAFAVCLPARAVAVDITPGSCPISANLGSGAERKTYHPLRGGPPGRIGEPQT